MPFRILHIDDHEENHLIIEATLGKTNHNLTQLTNLNKAKKLVDKNFDVLLLDLGLQKSQGLETLRQTKDAFPSIPIIVLTENEDTEIGYKAIDYGAEDFIKKNQLNFKILSSTINFAITRKKIKEAQLEQVSENRFKLTIKHIKILNEIYAYEAKNEKEFLDFSLAKAIEITQSKYGYIYKYNEKKKEFILNTWSNEVMPDCEVVNPQTCYELDKTGFWGEAVRQHKSIINNNFQANHPQKKGIPEGHVSISKFFTTPIFNNKKIIGVVGLVNKEADYENEDEVLITLLMNAVFSILDKMKAAEKTKQTFHAIEQAKTSVVITNVNGEIEYVNPYFEEVTGFTFKEVSGKNPRVLKSGHQPKTFYKKLWDTITTGKTWRGELKNRRKDKSYYWEEAIISPLTNEKGEITHFVAVKNDITKQKKALNELELNKRLLDQSEVISKTGGWEYDVTTKIIKWTDGLFELHGLDKNTKADKIKKSLSCYTKEDNKKIADLFERCIQTGEDYDLVVPFTNLKGKKMWVRTKTLALFDKTKVVKVYGVVQDITQQVKNNKEVKQVNQLMKRSFEVSKSGSFVFLPSKKEFLLHHSAIKVFKIKHNKVSWNEFLDHIYSEDQLNVRQAFEPPYSKGKLHCEFRLVFGKFTSWVQLHGEVIQDAKKSLQIVGFIQDIDERKSAELLSKENENLMSAIAANVPRAYLSIIHSDLTIGFTSGEEFTKQGLNPNRFYGLKVSNLFAQYGEDVLNKVLFHYKQTLKGHKEDFELFVDGQYQQYSTNPIFNERGEVDKFLVVTRNTTKEKQAALKIAENEQLKTSVINALSEGLVVQGKDDTILFANQAACSILELTMDQLKGKGSYSEDWEALDFSNNPLKPEDHPSQVTLRTGKPVYNFIMNLSTGKRNRKKIKINSSPILNAKNEVYQAVTTFEDITSGEKLRTDLINTNAKLENIFNQTVVGIGEIDVNGNFISTNKTFLKIFNLTQEEAKNVSVESLTHPDFIDHELNLIKQIRNHDIDHYRIEKKILTKNGSKWVDLSVSPIKNSEGDILSIVGAIIDISTKKQQEIELLKSKENLELIIDGTQAGTFRWNLKTKKITINKIWAKQLGYTQKELQPFSFHKWEKMVHPNDISSVKKEINKTIEVVDHIYDQRFRLKHKKGHWVWIWSRAKLVERDKQGNPYLMVGTHTDITEQKRVELQIANEQEKFKAIFDNAQEGILLADLETMKFVIANQAMANLLEQKQEALIGASFEDIHPTDKLSGYLEKFKKITEGKVDPIGEFKLKTKSGRVIDALVHSSMVYLERKKYALGMFSDITQQKENRYNLAKSQQLLERAQELGKIGNWEYNLQTNEVNWSKELFSIYEIDPKKGAPQFSNQTKFYTKKSYNELVKAVEKTIKTGDPYNLELEVITQKQNHKYIISKGQPEKDKNGNVIGIYGTAQDITERKKLEQNILKTKEQLQFALEGTQAATWDWYIQTGRTIFSIRWAEIIGYTLEELSPISIQTWHTHTHPDDLKRSEKLLQKHFKGELDYYSCRTRMKHKKGHWIWVWDRGKVVEWNEKGEPIRMVGTHLEVTDWVNAEEEVKASNKTLEGVIMNSPVPKILHKNGEVLLVNKQWQKLTGYSKNDIPDIATWTQKAYVEKQRPSEEFINQLYKIKEPQADGIWEINTKEGKKLQWDFYSSPVAKNTVLSVAIDVTEKQAAKEVLIENEEKFRLIYQSTGMGIGYYDTKGRVIDFNEQALKNIGKTLDEIVGKDFSNFIENKEEVKRYKKRFQACIKTKKIDRYTDQVKLDKEYWLETVYSPVFSPKKELIGVLLMSTDISRKVKTEKALKESEQNYRFLSEALNQVVWSARPNGDISFINDFGLNYFGKTLKQLQNETWLSIIHKDDKDLVISKWTESLEKQKAFEHEQRMQIHNGQYHWFRVFAKPQFNEKGNLLKWIGSSIDIQKQKQTELKEIQKQKEIELLARYGKKWLEVKNEQEVYDLMAAGVLELLNKNGIVGVSKYLNNNEDFKILALAGHEKWMKILPKTINPIGISGKIFPLVKEHILENKLVEVSYQLYELTSGAVPKWFSKMVESVLPNYKAYSLSFFKSNKPFGNISILSFDQKPSINEDVLITFVNEAATVLDNLTTKVSLEESNQRFELASATTKDVVWDWDIATGKFIWGNSVYSVFGDLDLKGHIDDWWNYIHKEDVNRVEEELDVILKDKKLNKYSLFYRFKRGDGTYAEVEEVGSVIRDQKKNPIRLVGALRDITKTNTYIKQIEQQNQRLKTISWIQSHELRAPLSRIMGIAELMKERELDPELTKELIEHMINSSEELDKVIANIVSSTHL